MESGDKNRLNSLSVSEVCGNLFSKTPENVVLFGFFEFISISGSFPSNRQAPKLKTYINTKEINSKFFAQNIDGGTVHFQAKIPIGELLGETSFLVELKAEEGDTVKFMINMAGPMPDHLEEKELQHYLKNQIWYYHRLIVEKNKRVWALENSLSWRLSRPFRVFFEILNKLPHLFTKGGLQYMQSIISEGGSTQFKANLKHAIKTDDLTAAYQHFRNKKKWEEPNKREVEKIQASFFSNPTISIITPVYNCPKEYLEDCIKSVLNQSYQKWELCIYDDSSTSSETIECLQKYKGFDDRIKIEFGKGNVHISEASNRASKKATGEYIGLLDHDDLLDKHALLEVVKVINKNPEVSLIYSDEDKLTIDGLYTEPYFKSDFNEELFLSNNYLNHFTVINRALFDKAGKFRKGYEGSQDYDLFLRIFSLSKNIEHIPKVLYHWRKIPGSTADNYDAKSYPEQASIKALTDFLEREKIKGEVLKGFYPGSFRIKREIKKHKKISIIIPFRDQVSLLKNCLKSISKTTSQKVEVILVNNQSKKESTLKFLKQNKAHKILNFDGPFNYSKINNEAAKQAKGELLLFLNNDVEAIEEGWLEAMLEHFEKNEVAAVGVKLSYPDFTLQHAGVILGINGVASHAHKHLTSNSPGYFMRANTIQNFSACTAACLMVRKEVFFEVGGFDDENLKIAFNDIDLCLKIREKGHKLVYTPFAHLIHHESKSRGFEDTPEKVKRFENEIAFMRKKWRKSLLKDPYYNPNLTLQKEDFSLKI